MWVTRGSRRYYYRNRKVRGRVERDYYGSGEEAQLAAALDSCRKLRREVERQARRDSVKTWEAACWPLKELTHGTDLLAWATLLSAGFHRHKHEWRRRRDYSI